MDTLSNQVLSKLNIQLDFLSRKHIIVLINDKGDILDLWGQPVAHMNSIIVQLKEKGNIKPFFRFKGEADLNPAAQTHELIPGINALFNFGEGLERFYTSLSVINLRMGTAEKGRHIGFITLSGVVPSFYERASGNLIYVDHLDRLKGFSHGFYELYQDKFDDPNTMLEVPVNNFFSPTPLEIQNNYLKNLAQPDPAVFQTVYEKDFTTGSAKIEDEFFYPKDVETGKAGLRWTGSAEEGSFFTIPRPVDFSNTNFIVTVEADSDKGEYPSMMIGEKKTGPGYIDHNGYLLGPHKGQDEILLKKSGFLLTHKVHTIEGRSSAVYEFIKSENGFIVKAQGRELLAYYDFDIIERNETYLTLFLRTDHQCLLKKVTLAVRPVKQAQPPAKIILKAATGNDRYFLLNRVENFQLTSSFKDVTGYRLQDVTELQDQINNLELRYQKQQKREKQLTELVALYERESRSFIGTGKVMESIREKARQIAASATTILIQGKTGTGKEVMARFIHDNSPFHKGPFIKVDCATIPATLMESELFGHEKGAFTGAMHRKIGMFEKANHGTMFLDEANNLAHDIQAKLLQFMQDFTVTRVGGEKPVKLDLRILVASSLDLGDMVKKQAFREDLYYRIAVVTLDLPLLKDRREDLPELCHHFLELFNQANQKNIKRISSAAYKKMFDYHWPGNIRELKNVVERAVIFCDGEEIRESHIQTGPSSEQPVATAEPGSQGRKANEPINLTKAEILAGLERHKGMVKRLASEMGVTKRALYYHFKKLGIAPNRLRKNPRLS